MNTTDKIPVSVLKRLPSYLHFVKYLYANDSVSSTIIAKALNFGEVQVRKDLQLVSGAGKPKIGYSRVELVQHLEDALNVSNVVSAVLVGVGHLGKALLYSDSFAEYGLRIVGAFDVAPSTLHNGRVVQTMDKLADFCSENGVSIGIVTVPESQAQFVAEQLVNAGVSAIWNFAPTALKLPEHVTVKNENLAQSLAVLAVQGVRG